MVGEAEGDGPRLRLAYAASVLKSFPSETSEEPKGLKFPLRRWTGMMRNCAQIRRDIAHPICGVASVPLVRRAFFLSRPTGELVRGEIGENLADILSINLPVRVRQGKVAQR